MKVESEDLPQSSIKIKIKTRQRKKKEKDCYSNLK